MTVNYTGSRSVSSPFLGVSSLSISGLPRYPRAMFSKVHANVQIEKMESWPSSIVTSSISTNEVTKVNPTAMVSLLQTRCAAICRVYE